MKNYDLTTKKKTYCVRHKKYCRPVTGSWRLREKGWECSDTNIPFPEFTTQKIKEERVIYANDQLQSYRGGQLSKEFLEAHPRRAKQMLKDKVITKEDVKKSKYVWGKDVPGVIKRVDTDTILKDA